MIIAPVVYTTRDFSQSLSNMSPPTNSVEFTTGKCEHNNVINDGRARVQRKSRAATSDMSAKKIVAQILSGLDFESIAKLGCQLNSLGNMARFSKTATLMSLDFHPNNSGIPNSNAFCY